MAQNRTTAIDATKVAGPLDTFFNECVGAGRCNEGLRADWQRQLRYAKEQLGFRYIRTHGLLHDDMGAYFEEGGKPVYNWQTYAHGHPLLRNKDVDPQKGLRF